MPFLVRVFRFRGSPSAPKRRPSGCHGLYSTPGTRRAGSPKIPSPPPAERAAVLGAPEPLTGGQPDDDLTIRVVQVDEPIAAADLPEVAPRKTVIAVLDP